MWIFLLWISPQEECIQCCISILPTWGLSKQHLFFPHIDSLNGPFPATSHRCHHKPKRCLPIQPCGSLSSFPLLFHPSTKGSQIVMDMSQRTVKRQASFCNAITFSNRPTAVYEQVRLKVTVSELQIIIYFKSDHVWRRHAVNSGRMTPGGQLKDPSMSHYINI